MIKTIISIILLSACLLTGCWDQKLLVNQSFVNGASFDKAVKGKIHANVIILQLLGKGGGMFDYRSKLLNATGDNIQEVGQEIDQMSAGRISITKSHSLLIGKDLAKQDLQPILDQFYRTPIQFVNGKIAIVDGIAADIMQIKEVGTEPVVYNISKIIQGAEKGSSIPPENFRNILSHMVEPNEDFVLPVIKKISQGKNESIMIKGAGFIHDRKYTGHYISRKDGIILNSLLDKLNKYSGTTAEVGKKDEKSLVVGVVIEHEKRKLRLYLKDPHQIRANLNISLKVRLIESPWLLIDANKKKMLEQKIAQDFTRRAISVIQTMQKAKSDVLGISQEIKFRNPKLFKQINFEQEYPKIQIQPTYTINIIDTGVIE